MQIKHIAVYTMQLERMKTFYETYFSAVSNGKYINPDKGFESYFLSFDGECQLELMQLQMVRKIDQSVPFIGLHHFAIAVGSEENVDELTLKLKDDGYTVVGKPRRTGDGYYESVILDPDGNRVEITV